MSLGGCFLDELYDDEWYMGTMLADPSGLVAPTFAAVYSMHLGCMIRVLFTSHARWGGGRYLRIPFVKTPLRQPFRWWLLKVHRIPHQR